MPYTLKLDWSAARTDAVCAALDRPDVTASAAMRRCRADLAPYQGVDATIKVDWPAGTLDAFEAALTRAVEALEADTYRARDNEPGFDYDDVSRALSQVDAARRDVRDYRATVALVVNDLKEER